MQPELKKASFISTLQCWKGMLGHSKGVGGGWGRNLSRAWLRSGLIPPRGVKNEEKKKKKKPEDPGVD